MITVKSALPNGKVALWERHPDHPGGEVFIADDQPVKVAQTPAVQQRIKAGVLVEVKPEQPEQLKAAAPEPIMRRPAGRK